jgi:hypothetical protein
MIKVLAVGVAALIAAAPASAAIYVGSYQVDDGPVWTSNPTVYSASEAAALLFGGTALDYDISTVSDDPLLIDHMGWYTTWGVAGGQKYQEDFKLDAGAPGYNDPGGTGSAISAYTWDNAQGSTYTNYVFRVNSVGAVPEPSAWALMLLGFGLVGGAMRASRRRQNVTISYA